MSKLHLVPIDLTKTTNDEIVITWSNGKTLYYPVRDLRLACPCAECIDEFTGEPLLNPDSVSNSILPKNLKAIGRYAIAFEFEDGHKSGIYSHEFLLKIGNAVKK